MDQETEGDPKSKSNPLSMWISLAFAVVLLAFGIQDLIAGKILLALVLFVASAMQFFVAHKIWSRQRNG